MTAQYEQAFFDGTRTPQSPLCYNDNVQILAGDNAGQSGWVVSIDSIAADGPRYVIELESGEGDVVLPASEVRRVNVMTIETPIGRDAYGTLLQVSTRFCVELLLVVRHTIILSREGQSLLDELAPWRKLVSEETQWPGTRLLTDTAKVYRFRYDLEIVERLIGRASSLSGWDQPDLPEDLCLLREDGTSFLTSITHENDFFLTVSEAELAELLEAAPDFGKFLS